MALPLLRLRNSAARPDISRPQSLGWSLSLPLCISHHRRIVRNICEITFQSKQNIRWFGNHSGQVRFTGLGQYFSSYRAAEHVRLTVCYETPNSRAASVAGTLSATLCVLFRFASRFFTICLPSLSKFVGARDEPAIREGLSLPLCSPNC